MAINYYKKMGELKAYTRDKKPRVFTIDIFNGNCAGVFNYTYEENGKEYYGLWFFINDAKHAQKMTKEYGYGKMFDFRIKSIKLDLSIAGAKELATILINCGYAVTLYKPQKETTKTK